MLTKDLACRFALRMASAVLLIAPSWLLSAGEVRLEQGELRLRGHKVAIRGIEESQHLYPWRSVEASSIRFDFYDLLARVSTGRL